MRSPRGTSNPTFAGEKHEATRLQLRVGNREKHEEQGKTRRVGKSTKSGAVATGSAKSTKQQGVG